MESQIVLTKIPPIIITAAIITNKKPTTWYHLSLLYHVFRSRSIWAREFKINKSVIDRFRNVSKV